MRCWGWCSVLILFLIAGSSQSSLKMRIKLGKQSVEKAKIELGGAVSWNLILFSLTKANCSLAQICSSCRSRASSPVCHSVNLYLPCSLKHSIRSAYRGFVVLLLTGVVVLFLRCLRCANAYSQFLGRLDHFLLRHGITSISGGVRVEHFHWNAARIEAVF